jgi:alpha-beta hydrolase superfamily lysophospholipase
VQAPVRAPVVIVHGFGEHLGRYRYLARALAASGRSTWAMDLPGHGRSDGSGADVGPYERLLADIGRLVAKATAASGAAGAPVRAGLKPVLFGHSMGGALSAAYATSRAADLGALVLSAPALHLALRPGWQAASLRALATVLPHLPVGKIDPAQLSRDPVEVRAFIDDALVWHGRVPARSAAAMHEAGRRVFRGAAGLVLPVLMVHGEQDGIVPVASTGRFFAALGSADKELLVVPGSLHEPHHEVTKDAVIASLVAWLDRH